MCVSDLPDLSKTCRLKCGLYHRLTYRHIDISTKPFRSPNPDVTFTSGFGGDGGGVTDEKAAKPVTAVQACVSAFVSVTLAGIFRKSSRKFPVVFVVT